MDRNQFKLIHSELIQQVQCVESNLKIIYIMVPEIQTTVEKKSVNMV